MMRRKVRLFFRALLLPVVLCFGAQLPLAAQPRQQEVVLLHTNDIHARIDNMPKLAYLADSLRNTHPYFFLLCAGDNFTGNPAVDIVPERGSPIIRLMNDCRFDVSALGNHEFDYGLEMLRQRLDQAKFPFICCNVDFSATQVPVLQPFIILKAGDISIPVVSVLQRGANGLPDAHPSKMEGVQFLDGITAARDFAFLKDKYGILIGLTHLGLDGDQLLAGEIPAFDILIGGHSHTVMETAVYQGGTMIVQAGSNLRFAGKTVLTFTDGVLSGRRYELIDLNQQKGEKSSIHAAVNAYNDNPELKRVAGHAAASVSGPDGLGCLMTDAVRDMLDLDIVFQNRGGIRMSSWPEGDITINDIFKLDPFGNTIITYNMAVKEMKELIRYSFSLKNRLDLEVSGIAYTVLTDTLGGWAGVEVFDTSGKAADTSGVYKVGVNSYIASAYDFPGKDKGTDTGITTAEALISWLAENKNFNYHGIRRISKQPVPAAVPVK